MSADKSGGEPQQKGQTKCAAELLVLFLRVPFSGMVCSEAKNRTKQTGAFQGSTSRTSGEGASFGVGSKGSRRKKRVGGRKKTRTWRGKLKIPVSQTPNLQTLHGASGAFQRVAAQVRTVALAQRPPKLHLRVREGSEKNN